MDQHLVWQDWLIIAVFMALVLGIGLYFSRRAGTDMQSFFLSARSLPWWVAGASMIATNFASDTPLWVTSLIRKHGLHYIWQYWAHILGYSMAVVLFSRLWRRVHVMTDVEFLELRYSGAVGGALRFWSGGSFALLLCPIIIGWVTKAMVTITGEALGLPAESAIWITVAVVGVALATSTLSGLWGVVYSDLLQLIIATVGTFALAAAAVQHVGGLEAMVTRLSTAPSWSGGDLDILPKIGRGAHAMSIWNAIGYFGILWYITAISAGYQTQRVLACKTPRHSTYAMLMTTTVYHGILAWPWIVVGLCSVLVFPDTGFAGKQDWAYPRMIVRILGPGMRGLLVGALFAAFVSTISTMFNWGSSYMVNDVYKRFVVREGSDRHYIFAARLATLFIAVGGGIISYMAEDIQQLLDVSFLIMPIAAIIAILRWTWWRLTAEGDMAGVMATWALAILMVLGKLDGPARWAFGLGADVDFSKADDLRGARMLFMMVSVTITAVVVSLLTRPTDPERLKKFVLRARPIKALWKPFLRQHDIDYPERETIGRTLVSWVITAACVVSLVFAIGKLLLGSPGLGAFLLAVFAVLLVWTVKRINDDFADEKEFAEEPNDL